MSRSSVPEPVTEVIDRASGWLPARMAGVERRLESLLADWGPRLGEDAVATLAAGGKRMRPLLVLLCAGPDAGRGAVRAATAIELVHMATLVHDDVLDAAPLRRGLPTVVARSGRDRAVAAGDLLFSRAFAELADDGAGRQVQILAAASVALARGELAQRHDAFDTRITIERYTHRCTLKTAALFECACTIGAAREPAAEAALLAFGRDIGLAFQILDDVLDVLGPAERTGKARGTDLLDGTVTLPFIFAAELDPGLLEIDLRGLLADEAAAVCDRIAATGAPERARADARERVERAKAALGGGAVTAAELELLQLVADGVVERYS